MWASARISSRQCVPTSNHDSFLQSKASKWNKSTFPQCEADYKSLLTPKKTNSCNWTGSRSVHVHTLNYLYQSSFGGRPRPPFQLGLNTVVWSEPHVTAVHTYPKDRHQGGNEPKLDSTKLKKAGVNTPLMTC